MATKVIAFQWIFAFVIAGLLLILTVLVAIPGVLGDKGEAARPQLIDEDRERAPLLDDH